MITREIRVETRSSIQIIDGRAYHVIDAWSDGILVATTVVQAR